MNSLQSLYSRALTFTAAFWTIILSTGKSAFIFVNNRLSWIAIVVALPVCIWGLTEYWDSVVRFWYWLRITGDSEESGSTTIRNIGLLIGTAVGLSFALWRSMVAQKQAEVAQQGLLNDRYQKGADMLGSDILAVRLGGIYALQNLAEEHPHHYYVQSMRVLGAFVRHPTKDVDVGGGADVEDPSDDCWPRLREDVQAIMSMMRNRDESHIALEKDKTFVLDLRHADLVDSNLRSVNLSGADLRGANLSRAYLKGANLARAGLSEVNLSGAKLAGADLTGTYLSNANLSGTQLCDMGFDGSFGSPVLGLNEFSLQHAYSDPDNPPELGGVVLNYGKGFPLVWHGKSRGEKYEPSRKSLT